MDKLTHYREIVRNVVFRYSKHRIANGQIEVHPFIDAERDHYAVMHIGWDGVRRIHALIVHIDIIDNKVWLQYDGTSEPVADALIEAGIPKEEIVLGFHPENIRQHTGFAIC
ncbi:MAG: XisI protein [Plectolyngbya sp. WJT66-NPBG17]|jgi:hypothetical protein|nr:XisI protein [Plectolyngbya sp. WJT66-NPBG17]